MRRVRVLHSFRDHNFTAGQYRCEDRTASNERCMIRRLLAVGAFDFGNASVIIRRTAVLMRRVRVLHSLPDAFDFGNTSVIVRRTAALMRRVRVLHSALARRH